MDMKNQFLKILEGVWNNPQYMRIIWIILPLIAFGMLMKVPAFKGWIGEIYLHFGLKWLLPKNKYHLFRNVTLPTEDGTTQIDHVVVSEFGVFVIETKNMKGWIFGSKNSKVWTQQIYRHKSSFQNPLRQNYKHTKTLAKLLELTDDQVISMIAFVGGVTFKKEKPENVFTGGWPRYIKSFRENQLSAEEVERCCELIATNRLEVNWKTHRQHVAHVKDIVANKSSHVKVEVSEEYQPTTTCDLNTVESSTNKNCPRCGSELVERVAKKGSNVGDVFMGCSAFPKCRYTAKIAFSDE